MDFASKAGHLIAGEYRKVVANWTHKLDFIVVIKKPAGGWMRISVQPDGPPKSLEVWGYVYYPQPARTIEPKEPDGLLVFRTRYKPKTTLKTYGVPGEATGEWVRAKKVQRKAYPGRKPLLDRLIAKREKQLSRLYRNYMNRALAV